MTRSWSVSQIAEPRLDGFYRRAGSMTRDIAAAATARSCNAAKRIKTLVSNKRIKTLVSNKRIKTLVPNKPNNTLVSIKRQKAPFLGRVIYGADRSGHD